MTEAARSRIPRPPATNDPDKGRAAPPRVSLPPGLRGGVTGTLRVCVDRIVWLMKDPPQHCSVQLAWWGDPEPPTVFRPTPVKTRDQPHQAGSRQQTAMFEVRCQPAQFGNYLRDMAWLVLDVITEPRKAPVGKASIRIGQSTLVAPLSGFFPVKAADSRRLAELHVEIDFKAGSAPSTAAAAPAPVHAPAASTAPPTSLPSASLPSTSLPSTSLPSTSLPPTSLLRGPDAAGQSDAREGLSNTFSQALPPRPSDTLARGPGTNVHDPLQRFGTAPGPASARHAASDTSIDGGDLIGSLLNRAESLRDRMAVAAHSTVPLLHQRSEGRPGLASTAALNKPALLPDLHDSAANPSLNESVSSTSSGILMDALLDNPYLLGPTAADTASSYPSLARNHSFDDDEADIEAALAEQRVGRGPSGTLGSGRRKDSAGPANSERQKQGAGKRNVNVADRLGRTRMLQLVTMSAIRASIEHMTLAVSSAPLSSTHVFFVDYEIGADIRGRLPAARAEGAAVVFGRRMLLPLVMDENVLEDWLDRDAVFTIYARPRGVDVALEYCARALLPLRNVLLAPGLATTELLPLNQLSGTHFGFLSVTLQLGGSELSIDPAPSTVPNTASSLVGAWPGGSGARAVLDEAPGAPGVIKPSLATGDEHEQPPASLRAREGRPGGERTGTDESAIDSSTPGATAATGTSPPIVHLLLIVFDAHNMSARGSDCQPGPRNLFVQCRVLSPADTSRSEVVWHTAQPRFGHRHAEPLAVTPQLLERMQNNVCVVEVWDRCALPTGADKLVGLCRLSLHPFYLALRTGAVAELLKGDLPIVAANELTPITEVRSGQSAGMLRVLLALGSRRQVTTLARSVEGRPTGPPGPAGSADAVAEAAALLDGDGAGAAGGSELANGLEHVFTVSIHGGRALSVFGKQIHGEADCFVRYRFPKNVTDTETVATKPVLCVPSPNFNACTTHTIRLPAPASIQRLLLDFGLDGIVFELWQRRYYPDIADTLVARGLVPMGRLCRLVGEYVDRPASFDWELELVHVGTGEQAGILEGALQYAVQRSSSQAVDGSGSGSEGKTQVSLSVVRGTGLLDAVPAGALEEHDLNVYLRAALLDSAASAGRARWVESPALYSCSAYPDIDCKFELQGVGNFVAIEAWHRPRAPTDLADAAMSAQEDLFLGAAFVKLPVIHASQHGWFPLSQSDRGVQTQAAGALELEVLGRASRPAITVSVGRPDAKAVQQIQVFVEDAYVPPSLQLSQCAVRYSLLGQPAVTSSPVAVGPANWCNLQHSFQFTCEFTAELEAHVAQHLFEVEFWGRAGAMTGDVFLGVASVDLAPLVFHNRTLVTDVYPIVRPRVASLENARSRIRVVRHTLPSAALPAGPVVAGPGPASASIANKSTSGRLDEEHPSAPAPWSVNNGMRTGSGPQSSNPPSAALPAVHAMPLFAGPSARQPSSLFDPQLPTGPTEPVDADEEYRGGTALYVTVEAAMHVPDTKGQYFAVSYRKDATSVSTHAVDGADLTWEHRRCVPLANPTGWGDITFTVWRAPTLLSGRLSGEVAVGNAVVDLGGLEAGLSELCGWYHILDARGVRQGQLKVRVVPLTPITAGLRTAPVQPAAAHPSALDHPTATPARPGSGPGVSLGPANLSESFLRKKLDENLQELDRLRLNLRSVLAEPLAGAPDPRHVRFEHATMPGKHAHGSGGAASTSAAARGPRGGDEHADEESFSLSPASASPVDSPARGHGAQGQGDARVGQEGSAAREAHERLADSRTHEHREPLHDGSAWSRRAHAESTQADEPPWRVDPHYTSTSAAPSAARPGVAAAGLFAGGSQGTSSSDDEIHRRAQELLRARPVFRPDIFSLNDVAAVRSTFLTAEEMRAKMAAVARGTRAADQPISFAEAQRVAGIFSGPAGSHAPHSAASIGLGPGTASSSAWSEPAPAAPSSSSVHQMESRAAGPARKHPSDETFVIGPSPHAARSGMEPPVVGPAP